MNGIKPPIDLRGSAVHSAHKYIAVDRIAIMPTVLRPAAIIAATGKVKIPLDGSVRVRAPCGDAAAMEGVDMLPIVKGFYFLPKRPRNDTNRAPAEPTNARIAVGFSGESTQPPCAYTGAQQRIRAAATRYSEYFFMKTSPPQNKRDVIWMST